MADKNGSYLFCGKLVYVIDWKKNKKELTFGRREISNLVSKSNHFEIKRERVAKS